ncbi:MAG: response regulator [Cyclobacteriaceae bacterium]
MLSNKEIKKIEIDLHDRGLSEANRRVIRKSKICIIDNEIDDLKSLHDGLKKEGFSNLTKLKKSPPINDILSEHYDAILLDLNDVAQEITELDGLGVLQFLKQREPSLPILVITGQNPSPEVRDIINLADSVRKKPVLASDLANDVEILLRHYHDKFWASIFLLKELNSIDIELREELGLIKRVRLHFSRRALEKRLTAKNEDIVTKLESVITLIKNTKSATSIISKLASSFLSDA